MRITVLLLYLLLGTGFVHSSPRMTPDPFFAAVGEAAEPLAVQTLIDAALKASGASKDESAVAAEVIKDHILKMKNGIQPEWNDREKAEYVLVFLHENLFRVYDEFQTRIDRVASNGRFNCVSSAVLYMIFSRAIGIPVVGISTADHAFCAVVLADGRVDVEATSVYGFDPGKKREFHDEFGNVTGYSYVPPSQYGRRTDLSERQLIALILQNRISLLESQTKYPDAVELAVDRLALDPADSTRRHLVRGVLNYVALLNERREYKEAIGFLDLFVDTYGWSEALKEIYRILHYNRVVVLIKDGAFSKALETIAEVEAMGWITPKVLQELRSQVAERILANQIPLITVAEGFTLLAVLRDDGLLTEERYLDFAVMLVSKEADEAASVGGYLAAAEVIDGAIALFGTDRRFGAARAAYRHNYAVEAHNAFAALFNEGEYQAASELLKTAMDKVPESSILRNDLKALEKTLIQRD